jgi:hypothetical protein
MIREDSGTSDSLAAGRINLKILLRTAYNNISF